MIELFTFVLVEVSTCFGQSKTSLAGNSSSPSAVPPAYYAHLAAFRARFYMEPEMLQETGSTGDGNSSHSSKGTRAAGEFGVRPLPALKENVKRVMFYC